MDGEHLAIDGAPALGATALNPATGDGRGATGDGGGERAGVERIGEALGGGVAESEVGAAPDAVVVVGRLVVEGRAEPGFALGVADGVLDLVLRQAGHAVVTPAAGVFLVGEGAAEIVALAGAVAAEPKGFEVRAARVGVEKIAGSVGAGAETGGGLEERGIAEEGVGVAADRGVIAADVVVQPHTLLVVETDFADEGRGEAVLGDGGDVFKIVECAAAGAGGVGLVGDTGGIVENGWGEGRVLRGGPGLVGIEQEVLVFDVDEAVGGQRAGVAGGGLRGGERDDARARDGGATLIPPSGDAVDDGVVAAERATDGALLGVEADLGFIERTIGEGDGGGAAGGGEVVAPTALVIVEGVEAGGEFPLHERDVEIEGGAAVVGGAGEKLRLEKRRAELGALGGVVDDAASGADAEEDRVGAAGIVEALGAVEIGAETRLEVVARAVAEDTARAKVEGVSGGDLRDAVVDAQGVAVVGLAVVGVEQRLLEGGGADVVEEFLREDVDDGGRVFERGVEAGAGEGVGGEVADVAGGGDLER